MTLTGSIEKKYDLVILAREEVRMMRTKCVFTTNFDTLRLLEKVTNELEKILLENEELRNK
jgi:hypothetical protein